MIWDEPFAYPLHSGGEVSDEPLSLSDETQAEVNRQLDEIDAARAAAAVSAQSYVIHGASR